MTISATATAMPDNVHQAYDTDFAAWAEQQGLALRRGAQPGSNLPIDWDNVAREIEGLARGEQGRIEALAHHLLFDLLKIAVSPDSKLRTEWMDEVDDLRDELKRMLARNSSLAATLPLLLEAEWQPAFERLERQLRRNGAYDKALPSLLAWKRYKMKASDILHDGLFPARGVSTWTEQP